MAVKDDGSPGRVAPSGDGRDTARPKHRRSLRRRGLLFGTGAAIAAGVIAAFSMSAYAVHDEAFQLDGDVSASTTTNVGGNLQPVDWDSLFTAGGANQNPLPTGFGAAHFTRDFKTNANGSFNTSDDSTYATGSKDILPISGWQCNRDNNVNNKIDINNAYAATYKNSAQDEILYFSLERAYNGGDANVGFWFFQSAVACESPGGSTNFSGVHTDGDLLIVSAFTKGGSVSGIDVYRWNGGANGSLGTNSVAQGADCRAPATVAGDTVCATVNNASNGNAGTITTPWLTNSSKTGVGNSLPTASFFEGGLNLTKAQLGSRCFNSFLGDTRSSQSLTATLFDFAGGTIGECQSSTVTTPKQGDGSSIPSSGLTIPGDPSDASLSVKDSAAVTVGGVNGFTGSVSFSLCGPMALDSTATCSTGGVSVGSTPITANGTVDSPVAIVTSAGRYCWRADFAATAPNGIPPSSDSSASECFLVNPRTPTLTTDAGPAGANDPPVDFGQPVTDTATLTGTAHKPGIGGPAGSNGSINPATLGADATGNITFTLYKDNACAVLATGTGTNPQTVAVNGNGTYGPVSFTPDAPGIYHWVATYPGDSPNTLTANTDACLDADEAVTVRQIPTTVKTKQRWTPNDTVTVGSTAGNLVAGGNVKFELFANGNCSGSNVYEQTVSVPGGAPTAEVGTTNTTFHITTDYTDAANSTKGPYSWRVTYTPAAGDTAHEGRRSCAEVFDIDYTNDPGPGVKFPA